MRKFLIALACLVPSVASGGVTTREIPPLPYNTALIHVDEGFNSTEQAHIRNAASAWYLFSQGNARLVTAGGGTREEGAHRILRINATPRNPLVDMVDAQHMGYKVLAFTITPSTPAGRREIYIIMDRADPDQFFWLVTHEMGHFLGLDDIQEAGHVMSGVGQFRLAWFTPSDLRECQAARVCK